LRWVLLEQRTAVDPIMAGHSVPMPMRWPLIPRWWKKPLKELPATFNAMRECGYPAIRAIHFRRSGLSTNSASRPVTMSMPITNPNTGIQLPVAS
jgi:hypothetical protein